MNNNSTKVHLCCGPNIMSGWVNVDLIDFGKQVIADIQGKWDFVAENSVDHIYCKDGYEHVDSAEHFLQETDRILKPGGTLQLWVPHFKNPSSYRLTHKRIFSWSYFDEFPEPHDKMQNLEVILLRIYIGHKDSVIWKPLHCIINKFPKWWERLFYVSNIEVVFKKKL